MVENESIIADYDSSMMVANGVNPLKDDPSTKCVKVAPVAVTKRLEYRVIVDNVDLTPDDIFDADFVIRDESFTHAAFETRYRNKSEIGLRTSTKSKLGGGVMEVAKVYATTISLDDIHIDHTLNTEEGIEFDGTDLSIAPSAYYLPKMNPVTSYPPQIIITLKETKTVDLFSLPSLTFEKGSPEGNLVEEENIYYEYITVGKGRNRKTVCQETQTTETITQTRHTLATRPQKKNAIAFASMWDMHDTYARLATKTEKEDEDEMVMYQTVAPSMLRKKKRKVIQDKDTKRGKTFEEIGCTHEYLDAVLLTERVLASLKYSNEQKTFRGLVSMDPLSLDLVYIYTLKSLWVFECEETAGKPIMSISFNPKNQNILATVYGKYRYADSCKGLVAIWCTKNPCRPERLYRFDTSLTCCSFSNKNANWLACGFCNGDVIILDITSFATKIISKSKRATNPSFEPIWMLTWCIAEGDIEYLMATCHDGRISRFQATKTHEFICTPMMRVCAVEGKLRGLETPKTCVKVDVPITRYPAVLCMIWHSTIDHCYLVGTDEGCIHRCSTHYLNQHMDVFRAHSGPVVDMCISPFMPNLLASCGADHAIRLWINGIDDVIMTLVCPGAVNGITFCPTNATILLSVSGNALSVWDLRRKIHMPCAEYTFPGNVILTYVSIERTGQNVFVGDTLGRIHTFHLEDTPIPAYFQTKLLDDALRRALCTRPQIIKQLNKVKKRGIDK